MNSFQYIQYISDELVGVVDEISGYTNVFIKEIQIKKGKTFVKFEILNEEGFKQAEVAVPNNFQCKE